MLARKLERQRQKRAESSSTHWSTLQPHPASSLKLPPHAPRACGGPGTWAISLPSEAQSQEGRSETQQPRLEPGPVWPAGLAEDSCQLTAPHEVVYASLCQTLSVFPSGSAILQSSAVAAALSQCQALSGHFLQGHEHTSQDLYFPNSH